MSIELKTITARYNTGVSADGKKEYKTVTGDFPVPNSLEEATAELGEELVFDVFISAYKVKAQGALRNNENSDSPVESWEDWKPSKAREQKSAVERAQDTLGKLTPEMRAALFAHFSEEK